MIKQQKRCCREIQGGGRPPKGFRSNRGENSIDGERKNTALPAVGQQPGSLLPARQWCCPAEQTISQGITIDDSLYPCWNKTKTRPLQHHVWIEK